MDSLVLACSFVAALAISACVVLVFSRPIDEALSRVIPPEMESAWRQYVKFGLFTVTFVGGLRLTELSDAVARRTSAGPPTLGASQGLLEVLKTIAGSLIAASATLLIFFGAVLAVYASMRVYQSRRAAPRPSIPAERQGIAAERHSHAKDRPRTEDSERLL